MAKYHISKKGTPAVCRAQSGRCPLGGEDLHFDSKEYAQKAADKMNESEFGIIPKKKEFSQTDSNTWSNKDNSIRIVRITNQNGIDLENAKFRIDVDGETVDTMISGFKKAKRIARAFEGKIN